MVQDQSAGQSLVWRAPDNRLEVRVAAAVMERMNVDVMRGFGVTRRRGTEVGGLLIGHFLEGSPATVHITDYEAISCEYAFGPSYVLSDHDRPRFDEALQRWRSNSRNKPHAVGFFRSHTRDELALGTPDLDLFRASFAQGTAIALLVKPFITRTSLAAFFPGSNGVIPVDVASEPVPFAAAEAAVAPQPLPATPAPSAVSPPPPGTKSSHLSDAIRRVTLEPSQTASPVALAPKVLSAEEFGPRFSLLGDRSKPEEPLASHTIEEQSERPSTPVRRRLVVTLVSAAAIVFGGVAGFLVASSGLVGGATSSAHSGSGPYELKLTAEGPPHSVLVQWRRDAPVLQSAARGMLYVTEAGTTIERVLSSAELRRGIVIYRPQSQEARFRLHVLLSDTRSLSEEAVWSSPLVQPVR